MKLSTFKRLPEKTPKKPKEGQMFLDGVSMIGQKNLKNKGDMVSFYMITSVKEKRIEYMVQFDKLT